LQQQGAPLPGGGERYDDYCLIYSGLLILTGHAWILHVRFVLRMLLRIKFRTYARLPGRLCLLQIHTRTEARERYGIRGDTYGDCLTAWCCRPCSLTQERREIELEEGSFEQSDK
jgi:Cys-rich protein (TIGR01571 family)